jgi:hypothetical protein
MSENVVPYGDVAQGAAITNRVGSEDPFETIFRPAKPALAQLAQLEAGFDYFSRFCAT